MVFILQTEVRVYNTAIETPAPHTKQITSNWAKGGDVSGDYNKALQASEAIRATYSREKLNKSPSLVVEYYQALIKLSDNGALTPKQACFLIADTIDLESIRRNYDIESIAIDAGLLELPDRHIDGDPAERWKLLKIWIAEMPSNYY